MKKCSLLLVCALLAGCEYTAPLVETPEIDVDKSVLGLWRRTKDNGETESLLVLPWSNREYLVSFPAETENPLFARVVLCRVAGQTLAQIRWIGTGEGNTPDDNRVFQYLTYSATPDTLTLRMLNSDVVSKKLATTAELTRAITENKANPDLFKEPMVYRKAVE